MDDTSGRGRPGWQCLVAIGWGLAAGALQADPVNLSYLQGLEPIAADKVAAYGPDLFGDRVNLFNGTLEFEHTDLSLPGNSALPVALVRHHVAGRSERVVGQFGDWDLEAPRIGGTFAAIEGWVTTTGGTSRCSSYSAPPSVSRPDVLGNTTQDPKTTGGTPTSQPPDGGGTVNAVAAAVWVVDEYHSGVMLHVPGEGAQEVLLRAAAYTRAPQDGLAYPLVTHRNWQIRCLPALQNAAGEGFEAVSPAGVRYRFDWMATRPQVATKKSGYSLTRADHYLMASQVTDRFGNWVRYSYDPANPYLLTRIEGSDGRVITITNSGGRAVAAHDGSRGYSYAYGPRGELTSVQRPDGSRWTLNLAPMVPPLMTNLGENATCDTPGDFNGDVLTGTMTHPSGAVGTFATQFRLFGRIEVQRACWYATGSTTVTTGAVWPRQVATQALVSKQISGPGLAPMSWSYAWTSSTGWTGCMTAGTCRDERVLTVTEPSGTKTRHTFGIRWRVTEGQLLKTEEGIVTTTPLKVTTFRHRLPAGQAWPEQFGTSLLPKNDWLSTRHRPQDQRIVTLQGKTFTWEADATSAGFDALARPLKVKRTGSHTRTDLTAYHDNDTRWVLGQLASLTETTTGLRVEEHSYDAGTALRTTSKAFGFQTHGFGYHADGQLAVIVDAGGRPTRLDDWRRGQPQVLTHPDGAIERQSINNLGLPDTRTNAVGGITAYQYDAMGRVAQVTPPAGDAVVYHPTLQLFEQVPADEMGLPAGHWRQTVSTGNARTVRLFDALWRERVELQLDAASPSTTQRVEETRYDLDGRTAFVSRPQRSLAQVDQAIPGRTTLYDALGREKESRVDSELGTLMTSTRYPSAQHQRIVTNPRGFATTFAFQTFDAPTEDSIASISAPEGATTSITRDVFGKASRITRGGITRRYVYDAYQRLCKTIEPESGSTVQAYDAAGNLAWRASGQALTSTSACQDTSVPASAKASFGYDLRNRLVSTSYGDGSPGITRSYTPDGLAETIATPTSTWTLRYNNRRLMVSETLSSVVGTYAFGYGIDAHGQVASMAYPGGPLLQYSPDALGRPTRVSGYLSGIGHHPDGQVSGYQAANGVAFSLTQNTRGLPLRWRHAGVVQDLYAYDANGNVASITDEQEGRSTRSMGYDGLDRLTAANGIWGAASYGYDAKDNLVSSSVGARSLVHTYDATNRLVSVTGSFSAALAYDANGNVINRAGQAYTFDIANRMASATGVASYLYDGLGRRAWSAMADGRTTLRVYGQSGRLLLTQDSVRGTTFHIHLGSRVVAETNSATGTRWLHTDVLGSPVAATGPSGTVLERTRYEPYGLTAAGTNPAGIGFTGHVNDLETGLVYMQHRYYDPYAGRFLSVDPVVASAKSGGYFNRYAYAANNPHKFKDPDGRALETAWDIVSLALSVNEFRTNPSFGNALGVALDAAAVLLPGIPGGIGAIRAADKTADAVSAGSKVERTASGRRVGDFTKAQKDAAKAENVVANGGQMKCVDCGKGVENIKSEKGVPTPSNQAQVHHEPPIHLGGGQDSRAVVLCPDCHKARHSHE
ncbi:MAG: RHS repeat-associated core domain-containing protein [Rubrivivax sp.]